MKHVRAKKARFNSKLACGHWVTTGTRIIYTGQRWECVTCVLARVTTRPPIDVPPGTRPGGRSPKERLTVTTNVSNREENTSTSARNADQVRLPLHELHEQIGRVIDRVVSGVSTAMVHLTPEQVAQALTDRELLTLELWAGDNEVIRKECERRQAAYEAFTRRFAPRGKAEPAES